MTTDANTLRDIQDIEDMLIRCGASFDSKGHTVTLTDPHRFYNHAVSLIQSAIDQAHQEGYKKGYADKGVQELVAHENDKGNQV